jgi:hypothetical protein
VQLEANSPFAAPAAAKAGRANFMMEGIVKTVEAAGDIKSGQWLAPCGGLKAVDGVKDACSERKKQQTKVLKLVRPCA